MKCVRQIDPDGLRAALIADPEDFPNYDPARLTDDLKEHIKWAEENLKSMYDKAQKKWGPGFTIVCITERNAVVPPNVLLAMRLLLESTPNKSELIARYIKRFHCWRSSTPPLSSSLGKPQLGNPFTRGFRFVLGQYHAACYSVGKDFGLSSFNNWTMLRHYSGCENVKIAETNSLKCRFLLIDKLLEHCPEKPCDQSDETGGIEWSEPANVTCVIDYQLYENPDTQRLFKALKINAGAEESGEVKMKLPLIKAGDPPRELRVEMRFVRELTQDRLNEAFEHGCVCVAYQNKNLDFSQAAKGSLSSGKREDQAMSPEGPEEVYWVVIQDKSDGVLEAKPTSFIAPNSFFVIWDCLWEAVHRTFAARSVTRSRGPLQSYAAGSSGPKRSSPRVSNSSQLPGMDSGA